MFKQKNKSNKKWQDKKNIWKEIKRLQEKYKRCESEYESYAPHRFERDKNELLEEMENIKTIICDLNAKLKMFDNVANDKKINSNNENFSKSVCNSITADDVLQCCVGTAIVGLVIASHC